jgi:predicted TIM-barrel fold metal-dependent hydrolase
MGVTHTLLLPAGSPQEIPSTHQGRSNGLAAKCGGNETVERLARSLPGELSFGANEVPDLPTARAEIERWLQRGARIIGEQKFSVACDGPAVELVASLAREHGVPVLLHFQVGEYNLGFERFWRTLERFPTVNFIGHAQTWWSNVDEYWDGKTLYPTGPVTAGGLTDRYLTDYPNMFGDLSAGSGLNFLLRDEDHARWFLERHQGRLLYGSDCADALGRGPGCQGAQTLAALRRLVPSKQIERKLVFENANGLLRLGLN